MKTACKNEEVFRCLHAHKLDFMRQYFGDGDADPSLVEKLAEALYCNRFAPDWCAESVYRNFEEPAFHLAPAFRTWPFGVRRQALYALMCACGRHGEAWLYREGERDRMGPDATEDWHPAWFDFERMDFGRSAVAAAVACAAWPCVVKQIIDRGHSVHDVDWTGRTALHHVALLTFEKNDDFSELLMAVLIGAGITLDACDANGLTALDTAIARKRHRMISALVMAGAVPTTAKRLKAVRRCAEKNGWSNELAQRESGWTRNRLAAALRVNEPGRRVRM